MHGVWSAEDTTPAAIESALRRLMQERQAESEDYAFARSLNLIVVVDRDRRGEIQDRLEAIARDHPTRTVLCAVEPGRTALGALATMVCEASPASGTVAVCRERVELDVGPGHLPHLATVVRPLLVGDVVTLVWSPHGHPEAVDAFMALAEAVLLDSLDEPDVELALARVAGLAERIRVVDLSWLRSGPWRQRISATFDPPAWRPALGEITAVTVRHRGDSVESALLLAGWLASRLAWEPGGLVSRDGTLRSRAYGSAGEIDLALEAVPGLAAPGLAGVTLATASGLSVSLDRGRGGLATVRQTPDGRTTAWTVLGASRGEGGILAEGVR
ncbi:MAG: glucose-6-phosphate dehydrogenase assembly protein OpcA, partial [Actinomycetota bacterium]|nr:glucose-6-phosphate dehydrogenase assembly protein OpcA [Actinomycetota bacterium]